MKWRVYSPYFQGLFLIFLGLLITGCDNDRPALETPQTTPQVDQSAPSPIASAGNDGGGSTDASGGGGGNVGGDSSNFTSQDPLLNSSKSSITPPDPLLAGDPLKGPQMPTEHSHWLRGQIRGANVTVLLNGVRLGTYDSLVDKDITMKLRKGVNFVTFEYQPTAATATAEMEVLESEHDPPIPPLVTFQSQPSSDNSRQPVRQMMNFIAR